VAVEVRATPLANKIIEELPRRSRRAYDQFEADLAARGCQAAAQNSQICVRIQPHAVASDLRQNGGSVGVLPDQPQSLTVMISIDVARG
jgi:hypothetical protein